MSGDGPPELVTLGEVMALFLSDSGAVLGRTDRFDLSYAGAEATVAVAVTRLGMRATFVGRVGADPLGARIVRELRGEGVDVSAVTVDADRPTGVLIRDAPALGPVSVLYHRTGSAGSALAPADLDLELVRRARVLHVTGITAMLSESAEACVDAALDAAQDAGVTVSFDPNVRRRLGNSERWQQVVRRLSARADIVFVGHEDLQVLEIDTDPHTWFAERGAHTVVVKYGAAGAEESGPDGRHRVAAHTVVAVDPVGAGDGFAAGWLSAWCAGYGPAHRLERGALVGAAVAATRGDTPGLPDLPAVEALERDGAGTVDR